jgi:hypothetical protein
MTMKKIIQIATFVFVMITGFFFNKVIQTDIGLISYFIVSMLLLFLNFYHFQQKKNLE